VTESALEVKKYPLRLWASPTVLYSTSWAAMTGAVKGRIPRPERRYRAAPQGSTSVGSVPSMAANLLPVSALGPGWKEGGIGVGGSNGDASQCAEPLWSIFYPPNYPAGSQENFGGYPIGGVPLWTDGVAAFNAGDQSQTGNTFAEAVGEADRPRFDGLLATLASCGSRFYTFSKDDPIELTPLQPFKFGTRSIGYLMTQTAHDQETYIGFIVAGPKYSCFWFDDFREPDRLTVFMQIAAKVAARLNLGR
jgi:hypothetical protein